MRRSVTSALAAVFFLALLCGGAEAQPRLSQVYAVTLGSCYQKGRWTMVVVAVGNAADEGADVNIVLSVPSGLREAQYEKTFHLPGRCERRVYLCVPLMAARTYPFRIVDSEGTELAKEELWANNLGLSRFMILTFDEADLLPKLNLYLAHRAGFHRLPGRESGSASEVQLRSEVRAGVIRRTLTIGARVAQFPYRPAGLDGMGAVAVGRIDHQRWRPSQVEALVTWIQSGGVLILFPGPDMESLRCSRLESLLPVRVFGSRKQNRLVFEDGLNRWEAPLRDYVDVLEAEVIDGETVLSDGEFPMVVRKRIGMGSVYFFAFPGPALNQWKDRAALLAEVLRGRERLRPFSQSDLVNKGPEMLDDVAGAEVAPASFVVATLGGFFLVATACLVVAHWRRRAELAWAVIVPAGIALAILSYQVGVSYRRKVGLSLNEIAVVSAGSGSSRAFRSAVLGIHTVSTLDCEIVAGDANSTFTSGHRGMQEGGEIVRDFFEIGSTLRITNLHIPPGAFPWYTVDSAVDLGGSVDAELQLGPDGLSGAVTNNTGMQLEDCLWAVNSYPYPVGDLAPGQSVQVTLSDANVKSKEDFTTEAMLGSRSRTRKETITSLFKAGQRLAFAPWSQRLFLLGWPNRDFITEKLIGPEDEVTRRSISLLCVEAAVRPAPAGEQVLVPAAFCTWALRPEGILAPVNPAPYIVQNMPDLTDLYFYLPEFAPNVQVTEAQFNISANAFGYDLTLLGRDRDTGKAVEITTWQNLDAWASITIQNAGRFQDPGLRALVLGLRVTPSKQPSGLMPYMAGWRLNDTSVSLKGVAR